MADWMNPSQDAYDGREAGRQDMQGEIDDLQDENARLQAIVEKQAEAIQSARAVEFCVTGTKDELFFALCRIEEATREAAEAAIAKAEGTPC